MERQYDLVIVGAGPAGLSEALYGSRAGFRKWSAGRKVD